LDTDPLDISKYIAAMSELEKRCRDNSIKIHAMTKAIGNVLVMEWESSSTSGG